MTVFEAVRLVDDDDIPRGQLETFRMFGALGCIQRRDDAAAVHAFTRVTYDTGIDGKLVAQLGAAIARSTLRASG